MEINLAWALAGIALSYATETQPLPLGTSEGVVGKWRIVFNNSKLELTHTAPMKPDLELPMMEIYVENLERAGVHGLLGPAGGIIGGYSEDQFIEDMVAYLPPEALHEYRDELGYRKDLQQ